MLHHSDALSVIEPTIQPENATIQFDPEISFLGSGSRSNPHEASFSVDMLKALLRSWANQTYSSLRPDDYSFDCRAGRYARGQVRPHPFDAIRAKKGQFELLGLNEDSLEDALK